MCAESSLFVMDSELQLVLERLVRNAKGLVLEATEEQLTLIINEPSESLMAHLKKSSEQVESVKVRCGRVRRSWSARATAFCGLSPCNVQRRVRRLTVRRRPQSTCRVELARRAALEQMDALFHAGEEAEGAASWLGASGVLLCADGGCATALR